MKKIFLIIGLLIFTTLSYSQSNKIFDTWISKDSLSSVHLIIKPNGVIERRGAFANENIWSKDPQVGKYTFDKNNDLTITWSDNTVEVGRIKFITNDQIEIEFVKAKEKVKHIYIFNRILEEIIAD